MEFNSQICTTRFQSERLLALGLKMETADMCINLSHESELVYSFSYSEALYLYHNYGLDRITNTDLLLPAWSLHRLIEMMPYDFTYNNNTYELGITDDGAGYDDREDLYLVVGWWRSNTYNDIIDCIEWLIKEGYFNKEYLEEKDETI